MDFDHHVWISRHAGILLKAGLWASVVLALIAIVASAFSFFLFGEGSEGSRYSEAADGVAILYAYAVIPFVYVFLFTRAHQTLERKSALPKRIRYFGLVMALIGAAFFVGCLRMLIFGDHHGPFLFSAVMIVFGPVLILAFVPLVSLVTLLFVPSPFRPAAMNRSAS